MEHLDTVMLGVVDICALLWYASQRARRWRLRLVWIAGAILGFVLVGPLALVVWAAASALFGPKDDASRPSEDHDYNIIGDTQDADRMWSPGFHFNYHTAEFDDGLDPGGIYIDTSHL